MSAADEHFGHLSALLEQESHEELRRVSES